jgi:WD40 repeat protein
MTGLALPVPANPFVGPRAFRRGEPLYGRDNEMLDLVDLLIAERVVLVYSPSGAGKTSLIQAALIERLESEGFVVPSTIRLNAGPTLGNDGAAINRYVASALACLDGVLPPERQHSGEELAAFDFHSYLDKTFPPDKAHVVLVFDQFEELLTLDPTDVDVKSELCRQVGQVLSDHRRWAILAMREDFVAALDPYVRHFPTRLSCRFRLDLLGPHAAREALVRPPEAAGVRFADDAVTRLVDDLRRVTVDRNGTSTHELGPYVEPVQLQVAGQRLWESLAEGKDTIVEADVVGIGNLDEALGDFYEEVIARLAPDDEAQRTIRDWFDRDLVTDQGIRSQTLKGPLGEPASTSPSARRLEDAHLLRSESRRGTTWFELAHDRLVEPVRKRNAEWRRTHLDQVEQQALLWETSGRPDRLLLGGAALARGKTWIAVHGNDSSPVVSEFVNRSEVERRGQAASRYKRWLFAGAVITVLALVASTVAFRLARSSEAQANRARIYELIGQSHALENRDHSLSILLALEASRHAKGTSRLDARAALYRAVNEESPPTGVLGSTAAKGVSSITFSPDGKWIATGADDGRVTLWDAETGVEETRFTEHFGRVDSVAFSPDGARLATASDDGTAVLRNLVTNRQVPALRHDGHVTGVDFLPDGKRVATVDDEGHIYMWDAGTGRRLSFGATYLGPLNDVAISPDGTQLAVGTDDGVAVVYDAATAAQRSVVAGHEGTVNDVEFSPDGQRIVTAGYDGVSLVANAATGGVELRLAANTSWVDSASFSPDGTAVVTTTDDGSAVIWNASDGRQVARFAGSGSVTTVVAYSPDGSEVVTAGDDGVATVYGVETGAVRFVPSSVSKGELVASPDGGHLAVVGSRDVVLSTSRNGAVRTLLARDPATWNDTGRSADLVDVAIGPGETPYVTGGQDGVVRLWNRTTGTEQKAVEVDDRSAVTAVDISPDGDFVVAATAGGTVAVVDLPGGTISELTSESAAVDDVVIVDGTSIAVLADGKVTLLDRADAEPQALPIDMPVTRVARLGGDRPGLVAATDDGAVDTWVKGSDAMDTWPRDNQTPIGDLAVNPDGTAVVVLTKGGVVDGTWQPPVIETSLVQRGSFSPLRETQADDLTPCPPVNPVQVAVLPGRRVAIAAASGQVSICDVDANDPSSQGAVPSVQFSPDGDHLASGGADATAAVWNVRQWGSERNASSNYHTESVVDVAWSPDGDRLASASDDHTVVIAALDGGRLAPLVTLRGHSDSVLGVDWSPDGEYLATASQDGTVAIWDGDSGKRVKPFKHDVAANDVAFSPDGKLLATASDDGKVRLWDTETGEEWVTKRGRSSPVHEHIVSHVSFTPDGRQLVSTGADGMTVLWDVESRESVRTLTGHAGYVTGLDVHPSEPLVATASDDGTILVTETESGEVVTRIELPTTPTAVSFSPDGSSIAISDTKGRVLINPLDDEALAELAEQRAGRELLADECERYLHHDC